MPRQLFFQQSNVVDKRLTPRWYRYEFLDTIVGSVFTQIGAAAVTLSTSYAFGDLFKIKHSLHRSLWELARRVEANVVPVGSDSEKGGKIDELAGGGTQTGGGARVRRGDRDRAAIPAA